MPLDVAVTLVSGGGLPGQAFENATGEAGNAPHFFDVQPRHMSGCVAKNYQNTWREKKAPHVANFGGRCRTNEEEPRKIHNVEKKLAQISIPELNADSGAQGSQPELVANGEPSHGPTR
ncbi:hypothetical protein B0H14DRAFT_2582921 [Mycena olivaceomarginata]|nr:hypothetical protein B0H14DRAFT_2582921 [Mycena olivaceomarginata]